MNPQKFSSIAHATTTTATRSPRRRSSACSICCRSTSTSRVLDLGCGRAELALRIIERFGSTVIAVDHSELMLDAARERAEWTGALGKLHLDDTDIRQFQADPETFHLSVMLGAGGIDGGHGRGSATSSRRGRRGGGYILIGEGYWQRKPPSDYVKFLGGVGRPSTSTTAATCRPASTPG